MGYFWHLIVSLVTQSTPLPKANGKGVDRFKNERPFFVADNGGDPAFQLFKVRANNARLPPLRGGLWIGCME